MPKTKLLILIFFIISFFIFPLVSFGASSNFDYKVMEGIPGFIQPNTSPDFNQYVSAVYKFGIWTVGIAALLMLSVGAFMYLTSAGNNAAMSSAKGVITDALIGFVLAMVAWLLLYIINPDLVYNVGITSEAPTVTTPGGGSTITPSFVTKRIQAAANADGSIDYSKALTDPAIKTSTACNKYDTFFSSYNAEKAAFLKSIAQLESGCGSNKGRSSENACGLMQLTEATATRLNDKKTVTCNDLINNDTLSVQLSAKLIDEIQKDPKMKNAKNKIAATFAAYNTGAGEKTASGKKASLADSKDCPNYLAFECSRDPGGLAVTITYAYNGVGLYNKNLNKK